MTVSLEINLADAAVAEATDRTLEMLNLLGQHGERGYRKALMPLVTGANWFDGGSNKAEQAVRVLNFVMVGVDHEAAIRLPDDKKADLCVFFIERIRHMKPQ